MSPLLSHTKKLQVVVEEGVVRLDTSEANEGQFEWQQYNQ